MSIIEVLGITKDYKLNKGKKSALSGISFSVEKGESVGIIGRNGAGKSTLLKVLAGITAPTEGRVLVKGKLAALLELGAGFHPEYTGIENIYLNGALQGKSRGEIREKLPEILDFADIGDFVHQKVKTYSTGMFLRLAFATASVFAPQVLLVDEALAVGDLAFQAKCFQRLHALKEQGTTVLYISHDIDSVRRFCDRVLWLEDGKLKMDGSVAEVTGCYMAETVGQGETCRKGGFGSHPGSIRQVTAPGLWEYGQKVTVTVEVCLPDFAKQVNLALSVKNREGLDLLVLSSREEGITLSGGRMEQVTFRFRNNLCGGRYLLAVGQEIPESYPIAYYDYQESALEIQAEQTPYFGCFHTPAEVKLNEEIKSEHLPCLHGGGGTE